jgi:hypothetical protein
MAVLRWSLVLLVSLLSGVGPAAAQLVPATAEITRLSGPVEVRLGGPSAAWVPARLGMRLAEHDEIRALGGASAELVLPDRSTLILAENSRFVVSRLRVGPGNQGRSSIFHLTTGKLRAIVTKAALQLVQLRQSTFAISTPAAVAAVRGTDQSVAYLEGPPMRMACRDSSCCCISAATGVGIVVPDGFKSDSADGLICAIPRPLTSADVGFFFTFFTLNPAGILTPGMTVPASPIDWNKVEQWGCDEPAAALVEGPSVAGFEERPEFASRSQFSPFPILQRAR